MTTERQRADVTTRARGDGAWDVGFHADGQLGSIDVGLAVEPRAVGVVVDAPGVGLLRVALDVASDGTTTVASVARRLSDGRDAAIGLTPDRRIALLEARRRELDEQLEVLITERDEARDRAAVLMEKLASVEAALEDRTRTHAEERSVLTSALQLEKDQRLLALGEREKSRAELERLREELGAGSATLMREVQEARAAAAAAEAERTKLSAELAELSRTLAERVEALRAATEDKAELLERLHAAESGQAEGQDLAAQLEVTRAELATRRNELEAATRQSSELADRLRGLEEEKAHLAGQAEELTVTSERVLALTAERDDLSARLDAAWRDLEAARRELDAAHASAEELQAELLSSEAEQEAASDGRQKVQAELDTARAELDAARAELATTRQRLTEAQRTQADVQSLRARISELQNERKALTAELVELRRAEVDRHTSADEQAGELAEQVRALSAEREALIAERDRLAAQGGGADPSALARMEAQVADAHAAAAEWDAALKAEKAQVEEARQAAIRLKAELEQVTRERDEARGVARQLHQRAEAPENYKKMAADLGVEKARLALQLDAVKGQLEQERSARLQAQSERDEYRHRFKALTSSAAERPGRAVDLHTETRPYSVDDINRGLARAQAAPLEVEPARPEPRPRVPPLPRKK